MLKVRTYVLIIDLVARLVSQKREISRTNWHHRSRKEKEMKQAISAGGGLVLLLLATVSAAAEESGPAPIAAVKHIVK